MEEENKEEEQIKYYNPIPDYFYLPDDFAEKFKELVIELGIVGKPSEQ